MTPLAHPLPLSLTRAANRRRPTLGWGLSLALHGLVMLYVWHAVPPPPMPSTTLTPRRIALRLLPAATPAPQHAAVTTPPAPAAAPSLTSALRATRAPAERHRPAPQKETQIATQIETQIETQIPAAPAFDLAAARVAARALARAERGGTPALRQDDQAARSSHRIQQRLEGARRADCLKGNDSVNLLANVLVLAHEVVASAVNDSGCKW